MWFSLAVWQRQYCRSKQSIFVWCVPCEFVLDRASSVISRFFLTHKKRSIQQTTSPMSTKNVTQPIVPVHIELTGCWSEIIHKPGDDYYRNGIIAGSAARWNNHNIKSVENFLFRFQCTDVKPHSITCHALYLNPRYKYTRNGIEIKTPQLRTNTTKHNRKNKAVMVCLFWVAKCNFGHANFNVWYV